MAGINMGFCCPSRCVLWCSAFIALLTLPLGGLVVWLGVRLKKEELFDGIDEIDVALVIIAFGGWLIVVGLIGLMAMYKKTRLGVGFYSLLLLSTVCVLMGVAGTGLNISQRVYEALDSEDDCKGNDYLAQANDATQLANRQLCSPTCPCDVEPDTFGELVFKSLTRGEASRIQDCTPCESAAPEMQTYKQEADYCDNGGDSADFRNTYYSRDERRYFPLIAMLEREYNCAGICQSERYYAFTNVTRGSPPGSCREDFRVWVGEEPLRYCAVIVAVGLLLFVSVLLPCVLMCQGFPGVRKGYEQPPTSTQI